MFYNDTTRETLGVQLGEPTFKNTLTGCWCLAQWLGIKPWPSNCWMTTDALSKHLYPLTEEQ